MLDDAGERGEDNSAHQKGVPIPDFALQAIRRVEAERSGQADDERDAVLCEETKKE